ncbi:UDP-glucuronosyltransferase 1A1-like [Corvus cornix cornix]|uniref:UDP-glucuronosyltransferase 1A1-like n=1 Tax=Corvus cornix cornix TaxID=932674 RepID=UPI00194EF2EA|nr:UDP-glucuronosyltransferase 1A1-like [Corvus cornix cornix]
MRPVVEKLQQKGHEVVVLVPSTSLYMKSKEPQNYTVKVYPIPYTDEYLGEVLKTYVNAHFIEQSVLNVVLTSYQSTIEISSVFFTNCKSLLRNEELMQYLKEGKFDVIFTDPILMCGPLVAEYLSIPSIYFLRGFPCGMDSAATQCPSPPSYVPRLFLDNSDSMTFSQRVKNMLVHLLELFYFHTMLVALLLPFLCLLSPAGAGKLLVIPMEGSHWLSMRQVLVELSKRGHEIVVVAPDSTLLIDSSDFYKKKTYPVPFKKEDMEEHIHSTAARCFSQEPFLVRFWKVLGDYRKSGAMFQASCKSLLYNQELMKYIGDSHFDVIFTDPISPCGQIIALHFSIPSVFFLRMVPCAIDVHAAQSPDPPSYIPRVFSVYTDHMTFSERVKNFLIALSESFSCSIAYAPFEELASEFLQKPVTMTELLSHGSIWLKRIDFVFEYPMPVMPNMVFIGGIHCGQKKPLSQGVKIIVQQQYLLRKY